MRKYNVTGRSEWAQWEKEIQQRWGLDSTPGSGNQFYAPGDAVDRSNPHDSSFRLEVDCKYTESKTYSLSSPLLSYWVDKAAERGRRFALAIRFRPKDYHGAKGGDYVLLSVDDFEELLEIAKRKEAGA